MIINILILVALVMTAFFTVFWVNNPWYYLTSHAEGEVSRVLVIPLPGKRRIRHKTEIPGIEKTCMHWDRQVIPHPPKHLQQVNRP